MTRNPDDTTCHPHLQGGVVHSDGWQVLTLVTTPNCQPDLCWLSGACSTVLKTQAHLSSAQTSCTLNTSLISTPRSLTYVTAEEDPRWRNRYHFLFW